MNPRHFVIIVFCITACFVGRIHAVSPAGAPVTLRTKMEGRHLQVPLALSYQQIVLEQRTGSGWKPIAVEYPRTLNRDEMRNVSFPLPQGVESDEVRVQGYRAPKFPARFLYGKKAFSRTLPVVDPEVSVELDRLQQAAEEPMTDRKKNDAGIWQMAGSQLFFFSPFRGLQVLDLGDPAHPLRTGSLRLPVTGEQMFILNEAATEVLLLGRSNGKERPGGMALFLVGVTDGVPELRGEVPLPGRVADSRIIGTQLYLLSARKPKGQGSKTVLTRVELAGDGAPKILGATDFAGGSPAFQALGGRLMVSVKDGDETRRHEVTVEGKRDSLETKLVSRQENRLSGYEVAISAQTLRVHSIGDPSEKPVEMPLAWQTNRVLPVGDFLVQVEDGDDTDRDGVPGRLRITPANDPDLLVEELELGPGRVVGLSQKGDILLLAQWVPAGAQKQAFLRTWALDLRDPAALVELGTVEHALPGLDAWDLALGKVQPLWVNADTLVWFLPAEHHPRLWWSSPMSVQPAIPASTAVAVMCPLRLVREQLTSKKPQVLRIQGRVTHTSSAQVSSGLVYFSHDTTDETALPEVTRSPQVKVPLRPLPGHARSWLQVVDFRSGDPLLRNPVSIPGQLLGVTDADAQGAVLLTHNDLVLRSDTAPVRLVQASAYDGLNAYQLDNYVTATSFGSAAVAEDSRLYLTREKGRIGVVAIAYQPGSGRLAQSAAWGTNTAPEMLHVAAGHLLASSHGDLEVASIGAEAGKLTPMANYDTPMNLWLQVDRAAVTPTLDLWIPAGNHGVEFLQKQGMGQ